METFLSVTVPVCSCFGNAINSVNPTKGMAKLREKKEELIAWLIDVNRSLMRAEVEDGEVPTDRVMKWFNDVKGVMGKIEVLENRVNERERGLNGQLGASISSLIREVTYLSEFPSMHSRDDHLSTTRQTSLRLPTTRLTNQNSAQKKLEMVWKCLMDDEIRVIGVYGTPGVGKTTIMKEINRLLETKHCFDKVIWVTLTKDTSVRKLQDHIAKALNLTLPNEGDNTAERLALLLQEFAQSKRFLLILDDVWQAFSLHDIGIPETTTKDNGCKLVLVSRSLEVCKMMGCRNNIIEVELLSQEEAWELFMDNVGVELAREETEFATAVAKECACLPLAIVVIGSLMRGKDGIREWRSASTGLQESSNWITNMEAQVIKCLKFGYNHMEHDILKKCLLYCALYPENFDISPDELIDHWVMEGLINGRSIQDELDRGHVTLHELKCCCMLEYGSRFHHGEYEYVKLHDLIRQVVVCNNPRIMVIAGVRLEQFPDEEAWGKDLEWVSFMGSFGSGINEILISPNCPRLTTLLLNHTSLKHIEMCFFMQMQGLRVLDLSFTLIELLPESISNLVNLLVLVASGCHNLKRVPSLEKLQWIRVLRLNDTAIEELPHGMAELVNLRRLDITGTRLRSFPALLLSKLSWLQELLVFPVHISVNELLCLPYLENLSIGFKDLSDMNYYIGSAQFKGLDNFTFDVGHARHKNWGLLGKRGRNVSISNDSHHTPENAILLPQGTTYLRIREFNELRSLLELACLKDVTRLRKCFIQNCSEIEYISSAEKNYVLQYLEDMEIEECPKLIALVKVTAPPTFSSLKKLVIANCHNLKYVFSSKWVKQLKNLVEVVVTSCGELEELIADKRSISSSNNTIVLPELKMLNLWHLTKLKCIWKGAMVCKALETVIVSECVELKRLPQLIGDKQPLPPSLHEIKGSSEWWESLEWDAPSAKTLLQPKFHGI